MQAELLLVLVLCNQLMYTRASLYVANWFQKSHMYNENLYNESLFPIGTRYKEGLGLINKFNK